MARPRPSRVNLRVGDRALIVSSRDKSLIGLEARIQKRELGQRPPLYVISLDDGAVYAAPPSAHAGPLVAGYHGSPGGWADCVWRPHPAPRRCRRSR